MTEGALGAALRGAQDTQITKLCSDRASATSIEATYAFVRFKGVNLDEGWAPDPTDAVGLDLLFRVTDTQGSSVVEVGYVVGLAKAEVASLVSLLKPTGAVFLQKKAMDPYASAPPQLALLDKTARAAAFDLAHATLTVGPSTIDIVLATEPGGLFLGDHRVRLGPRSDTFPAFVSGPLTERLVAPLLVDY